MTSTLPPTAVPTENQEGNNPDPFLLQHASDNVSDTCETYTSITRKEFLDTLMYDIDALSSEDTITVVLFREVKPTLATEPTEPERTTEPLPYPDPIPQEFDIDTMPRRLNRGTVPTILRETTGMAAFVMDSPQDRGRPIAVIIMPQADAGKPKPQEQKFPKGEPALLADILKSHGCDTRWIDAGHDQETSHSSTAVARPII